MTDMAGSEIPSAADGQAPLRAAWSHALARPPSIVAEVLWAIFVAVVAIAQTYPRDASLFPTIAGGLGVILCSLFLILSLASPQYVAQNIEDMEETEGKPRNFWIAFAASPIYTLLIYLIGFDVSTFVAMIAMPYLLGYRGWFRLIAISLALVVVLHLVFVTVFEIDLPAGLAGDFFLQHFVYED
jgi:hypothetical protein